MTLKTNKQDKFKGIDVDNKVYKPVPVTQIVVTMIIIFGLLILLDKCNVIEVTSIGM